MDCVKYMDSKGLTDELFKKKKLAYPYELFKLQKLGQALNLTKKDFWSTITQSHPLKSW